MDKTKKSRAYLNGYNNGYAARGRRFEAINRDEIEHQVQAILAQSAGVDPARVRADFTRPGGQSITLLMPQDMKPEDLEFFREVVEPYLDLLEKRLKEKEAPGGLSAQVGDKGDGNAVT